MRSSYKHFSLLFRGVHCMNRKVFQYKCPYVYIGDKEGKCKPIQLMVGLYVLYWRLKSHNYLVGATFRNENNSFRNAFIRWYFLSDTTGLNTQRKVVGREKDTRETNIEREKKRERERERECVLLQIGGGVGNKFGRWRKYLQWI